MIVLTKKKISVIEDHKDMKMIYLNERNGEGQE